jgi:hypothetical protein
MDTFESAKLLQTIHNAKQLSEVKNCIPDMEDEKPTKVAAKSQNNKVFLIIMGIGFLVGIGTIIYIIYQKRKKSKRIVNDYVNDI